MSFNELDVYFNGVSGTLTVPATSVPPTHKVALILHGQGGHRNYCYQKLLAHQLAQKLGMYSLRIDFRGCGNSDDNEVEDDGRTLAQDIVDILSCCEFLRNGDLNPVNINFTISTIVSHSRGGVAMFLWAMEQDNKSKSGDSSDAIIVPNLINASARFTSPTVLDRYPLHDNEFVEVPQLMLRHGKYQDVFIKKRELLDLAEADLSKLNQLSLDTSVLSIYGLEDAIIPIVDSANFANVLNRGHLSHQLELIPMADHNFYGVVPIENPLDAEDYNPHNLPLNKSKLVNYSGVVVDKIIDYLNPHKELERFLHATKNIGHLSRWKQVDGVSNFRDIGGWMVFSPRFPLKDPRPCKYYVKHNYMFRCAQLGNITEDGLSTLRDMHIKVLFDLRSDGEISRDGYPDNLLEYGIKRVHAPVFSKLDYSPQAISVRYTNLTTSWYTYVHVYEDMLLNGTNAFKTIFEHIRDHPDEPFVFHCTAGKDRTGVLGMLILLLTGLDKHTIAKEYELTAIGLKPDHDKIKQHFLKVIEKTKASIGTQREGWSLENEGFENLISSRYEAMLSTIEMFNSKFNGIIAYMRSLGFTNDDILTIYDNLMIVDRIGYFRDTTSIEWSHRNSQGPNL